LAPRSARRNSSWRADELASNRSQYHAVARTLQEAMRHERRLFGRKLGSPAEMFAAIDRDDDGHITLDELNQGLRRLDVGLSEDQVERLLGIVDKNQDACIDQGEFEALFQLLLGDAPPPPPPPPAEPSHAELVMARQLRDAELRASQSQLDVVKMRSVVVRCAVRTMASAAGRVRRRSVRRALGRWKVRSETCAIGREMAATKAHQDLVAARLLSAGRKIYEAQLVQGVGVLGRMATRRYNRGKRRAWDALAWLAFKAAVVEEKSTQAVASVREAVRSWNLRHFVWRHDHRSMQVREGRERAGVWGAGGGAGGGAVLLCEPICDPQSGRMGG
jgi:hypothetical protein